MVKRSLKQSDTFKAFDDLLSLYYHINFGQGNGGWVTPSLKVDLLYYLPSLPFCLWRVNPVLKQGKLITLWRGCRFLSSINFL